MLPLRFRNIRPYLATFIHRRFDRPSASEMMHWLFQPGKTKRASVYIKEQTASANFREIRFQGIEDTFYYPLSANWLGLCQTIDEIFNPKNWHHFLSQETPLTSKDTVVDCGAAEGLFSFYAARRASKVYAIEPVPSWHAALEKTFSQFQNVELLKVGVGHRNTQMRMTDEEIYSRISSQGKLEIPVRTLDSLFASQNVPISFIKADIEGFEFQMLLGAEEVIRINRPKISITVYHDANHVPEILQYLRGIHSDYAFRTRGIADNGNPILLQVY